MFILENYLNESTDTGYNDIPDIEMSNEGFTFETGGCARAISLAESACNEIEMVLMASEVKSCKMINENAVMDAYVLQENVITNALAGIKKIIMKLWARMKEVASSVKLQFEKLFSNSAFIKDAEKQLEKITDFKDLEFEGYEFTIAVDDAKGVYTTGANLAEEVYKKAESKLGGMSADDKEIDKTRQSVDTAKDELEELSADKFNKALSEKVFQCEPEKINEELFKKFRNGKDSKDKLTWSKSTCIKAVKELQSLSNKVNGVTDSINITHKAAIKAIDTAISASEKIDRDAKDTVKPLTTAKLKALKDKSQCVQAALNLANRVSNATLEALKEDCSQSKNHIMAALSQGRKNARAAVNESTMLGEGASFFDGILDNY